MMDAIKLTQFSHGAGCGCKISPKVLDTILSGSNQIFQDPRLLVGNQNKDDAAVYAIDEKNAIISTTDFFMPIVDDPFQFGSIAATNAISDVYAMGGNPIMAISILGWPIDKIPAEIATKVIDGAKNVCKNAGITLAGGHSIDSPEPIFGLAVTGTVKKNHIKTNDKAKEGSLLFLTKPLGIGILTTAEKKGLLRDSDHQTALNLMLTLNDLGKELGKNEGVTALTDVTGFGLLGHLIEICEASGVTAEIRYTDVPVVENLQGYLDLECVPGGTIRNFDSYGEKVSSVSNNQKNILCDPQTSGGLLVAVDPKFIKSVQALFRSKNLDLKPFGQLKSSSTFAVEVKD